MKVEVLSREENVTSIYAALETRPEKFEFPKNRLSKNLYFFKNLQLLKFLRENRLKREQGFTTDCDAPVTIFASGAIGRDGYNTKYFLGYLVL